MPSAVLKEITWNQVAGLCEAASSVFAVHILHCGAGANRCRLAFGFYPCPRSLYFSCDHGAISWRLFDNDYHLRWRPFGLIDGGLNHARLAEVYCRTLW
jgi:hypothetical protein